MSRPRASLTSKRNATILNVHDAKTNLSRLLARVEKGEEVLIARAGRPVARLSPVGEPGVGRILGRDVGVFVVPADFDAPLPDDVVADFET